MTTLAVKFLSAASVGIVAIAPFAIIPLSTVHAAEECLTSPKAETPPGKHWHYRSERSTKRHCWYLREEGEIFSSAATLQPARQAAPEVAPATATKLARLAADAHAELLSPQIPVEADPERSVTTPAASIDPNGSEQNPSNNASPETAQSQIASRWLEPTGMLSPGVERPTPTFVVASAAPDANLVGRSDKDLTPKIPAAAPTQVGTAAMGTPASLQMLLLGTFGAIAFSWLTGSYLMARMQRRPKRPVVLNPPQSSTGEPTHHGHPNLARTDDSQFDAPSRPGSRRTRAIIGPPEDVLGDNACEIQQLLARFANQEQAEPEKTRTSVPEL